MRYTYPDQVRVKLFNHSAEGTVMDSRINRRFHRQLRQHVPYEVVYLISFGPGRGCWFPEDQLESI